MLTLHAFNALLKTLEEPPEYTILILATTDFEKVPATISSRTQQFHFKKIPLKEIIGKLKTITEKENISIDSEALELIASAAEGSLRDAESLLDQLSSQADKKITTEQVENMIGKAGFQTLNECAGYLLSDDLENALSLISKVAEEGYHLPQFTKDLLVFLRRAAVLSVSPKMSEEFKRELTDKHLSALEAHAKSFNVGKHIPLIKNLIEAYSQMRYSQFPIIPLEVAVIESISSSSS